VGEARSNARIETGKELEVTVNVTQPEGTPAAPPKPPDEDASGRPVWMEKDKIFGIEIHSFPGINVPLQCTPF